MRGSLMRIHHFVFAFAVSIAFCVEPAAAQSGPGSQVRVGRADAATLAHPAVRNTLSRKVRNVRVDAAALARFAEPQADLSIVTMGPDPLTAPATVAPSVLQNLKSRPGVAAPKAQIVAPPPRTRMTPARPTAPGPGVLKTKLPHRLDGNGFLNDLHDALAPNVAGYAVRLRKGGQNIGTLQWNWAQTPADASIGWTPGRRMHLASVSKLLTAIALTKVLDDKGIPYNTPIIGYLPDYWAKGANVGAITFADLMTHRSGYNVPTPCCDQSFGFLKQRIAAGPNASVGDTRRYHNLNFGLQRVLIATVGGYIDTDADFGANNNDPLWNAVTNLAYDGYMQNFVFKPAGVTGATLIKPASPVRAYRFPANGQGWNSGSLAEQSGGVAWHMSPDEVLNVMDALRRKGTIMSKAKAQGMLAAGFGLDSGDGVTTPAGKLYHKNGRWQNGGQVEQNVVFFLPEDMEVAVFVNSPIGAGDVFLRSLVQTAYTSNLYDPN